MIDERYRGWEPLAERVRAAAKQLDVAVHIKAKNGALSVSVPFFAPQKLKDLAEQIERESDVTCQYCSNCLKIYCLCN